MQKSRSNLSISTLLLIFYVVLLIVTGIIRYVEQRETMRITDTLQELTSKSTERQQLIGNLWNTVVSRRAVVLEFLFRADSGQIAQAQKRIEEIDVAIANDVDKYRNLITDSVEASYFDVLERGEKDISALRDSIFTLVSGGRTEYAKTFSRQKVEPEFEKFEKNHLRLISYVNRRDLTAINSFNKSLSKTVALSDFLTYTIVFFLVCLGVVILYSARTIVRKRDELKASEHRYRTFIEETHEIIVRSDSTGRIIFANPKSIALFEYEPNELYKMSIFELLERPYAEQAKREIEKRKTNQDKSSVFGIVRSKSGKEIYLEGNLIWEYQGDQFDGTTAFLNDVTEKSLLQQSLSESENKFRNLFDLAPIPMFTVDPKTLRFMQVNTATLVHYGYSEEEFLQMSLLDIRPKEEVDRTKKAVAAIIEKNNSYNGSHIHITKEGTRLEVEIFASRILIDDEPLILSSVIDVTERKQHENRISKAIIKTQEEERYEIGSELHDNVCQILASTKMTMNLMKPSLPEQITPLFSQTLDSINLATDEIRNLSHRLAPVFFKNSNLKESLERLLNTFNLGNEYSVSMYFDESAETYPMSTDLQLNLYRIVQEQLRNIIKHAKATEVRLEVMIFRKNLNLLIADNGVGFEPTANVAGIGLNNIKRRAEFFSGQMRIYSAPGEGCEMLVKIPLKTEDNAKA